MLFILPLMVVAVVVAIAFSLCLFKCRADSYQIDDSAGLDGLA